MTLSLVFFDAVLSHRNMINSKNEFDCMVTCEVMRFQIVLTDWYQCNHLSKQVNSSSSLCFNFGFVIEIERASPSVDKKLRPTVIAKAPDLSSTDSLGKKRTTGRVSWETSLFIRNEITIIRKRKQNTHEQLRRNLMCFLTRPTYCSRLFVFEISWDIENFPTSTRAA